MYTRQTSRSGKPIDRAQTALRLTTITFFYSVTTWAAMVDSAGPGRTWTLDNGIVRKVLQYDNNEGLRTAEWRCLTTGATFFPTGAVHQKHHGFSASAGDANVSGAAADTRLTDAHQETDANGDNRLELTFASRRLPVRVVLHQELGRNQPAVRQWLSFTNLSESKIVLRHLSIDEETLAPGPERDLIAFGGYGEQPRELFFTGRVNDSAVLLENARTGDGFAVLSEVPGYLRRTELGRGDWTPDFYAMYDTDLFPFERTLAPKETFATAGVSVLLYRRNTVADPHWLIPQYVRDRISRQRLERSGERPPQPWIYNTWEPFHNTIDAALIKQLIPRVASSGFTLLTLDDGWEERFGENAVNRTRFPDGLGPVFEASDQAGLRRGLWIPVALIDQKAEPYVKHPDWVCRGADGRPKLSQGQGVVMSLASPYKFAAIERISRLVQEYRLSYVKLDLTTVFNTYGEAPGCYEQRDEYKTAAESSVRIYEALGSMGDTLHQRFPDLKIDYTFELWGEKHLIDYGLLRVADLDWLSNVRDKGAEEAGPLAARSLLYARGMAIPADAMLIGNLQAELSTWQERAATAMGSGPVLLGDLRKLSDADAAHYRDWIGRYTKLRAAVEISDSFFPLGSWRQVQSNTWDGFARLSKQGEGLIVLFRNESSAPEAEARIPGFPDGACTLTSWSDNKTTLAAGSTIRAKLSLPFSEGERVKVVEVRRR